MLLELFPGARFVHVHRDPYAVYQSTLHLLRRLWPIHSLQAPPGDVEEQILRRYTRLHDAFFAEKDLIPDGQFCEVRYEQLVADPVEQVRRVYAELHLPGFEAFRPRLRQYVESLSHYEKNQFDSLPLPLREKVAAAWERSFDAWEYPV